MADVYDFYAKPPKTKQDLRDYLTSWLQNVDDVSPLVIQGEAFILEKGFVRAFNSHCVYRSLLTNEYVWWVSADSDTHYIFRSLKDEDDRWWVSEGFDVKLFPKKRFSTYESMLETVINDYYIAWKLSD